MHWPNPSGRTMALGSTQPLTEMNIKNISWWGLRRPVRRADKPPSRTDCLEIWEPQPPGTLRACNRPDLGLLFITNFNSIMAHLVTVVCRNSEDDLQVWKPWIVLIEVSTWVKFRWPVWMSFRTEQRNGMEMFSSCKVIWRNPAAGQKQNHEKRRTCPRVHRHSGDLAQSFHLKGPIHPKGPHTL